MTIETNPLTAAIEAGAKALSRVEETVLMPFYGISLDELIWLAFSFVLVSPAFWL